MRSPSFAANTPAVVSVNWGNTSISTPAAHSHPGFNCPTCQFEVITRDTAGNAYSNAVAFYIVFRKSARKGRPGLGSRAASPATPQLEPSDLGGLPTMPADVAARLQRRVGGRRPHPDLICTAAQARISLVRGMRAP